MILCFSGTGNSRYVADALADRLDDVVVDLAPYTKEFVKKWGAYPSMRKDYPSKGVGSHTGPTFVSDDGEPFVVVSPLYGWRIPEVVSGIVETGTFIGSNDIYFVSTYGMETAHADVYAEQAATHNGLRFKGFTGILMPSTYAKLQKMPSSKQAREIRLAAKEDIDDAARRISRGELLETKDKTALATLKSGAMHRTFRMYEAGSSHFVVSSRCSKCDRCELFCPVGDITMTPDGPKFGDKCISCYACIHRCPDSAIDVKNQTEANGRYICPGYREEMEDLDYEAKKAAAKAEQEAAAKAAADAAKLVAALAVAKGATADEAADAATEAASAVTTKRGGRLAARRAAMEAAKAAVAEGEAGARADAQAGGVTVESGRPETLQSDEAPKKKGRLAAKRAAAQEQAKAMSDGAGMRSAGHGVTRSSSSSARERAGRLSAKQSSTMPPTTRDV